MADRAQADWERLLAAERHLLTSYKGLAAPWNDWAYLAARGRFWAQVLADQLLRDRSEEQR